MKNLVKSFDQFITESHGYMHHEEESMSNCCGSPIDEMGMCSECGEYAGGHEEEEMMHHEEEPGSRHHYDEEDGLPGPPEDGDPFAVYPSKTHDRDSRGWSTMHEGKKKEKTRKEVLKDADEKYPNLKPASMKKGLEKMKGKDFKEKAKKNFGWADKPEAAAAAYMRKATGKEPRDI